MKPKCAIAIDTGNECTEEFIRKILPYEWRPHVTLATFSRLTEVVEMVRDALPAVLILHTNLLLLGPEDAIANCVAVSPNTRYLLLTAWSEEHIDNFREFYEPLHISLGTLRMPFDGAQLIATLEAACGLLA